jgi:hypothetical protein
MAGSFDWPFVPQASGQTANSASAGTVIQLQPDFRSRGKPVAPLRVRTMTWTAVSAHTANFWVLIG